MSKLTFERLRNANVERCDDLWHPVRDWSLQDWALCVTGEAGSVAHVLKYARRQSPQSEMSLCGRHRAELAEELADLIIYADLLAARAGIDLGEAVQDKFNAISRKNGSGKVLK